MSIEHDLDDIRQDDRTSGDLGYKAEVRLWMRLLTCSTLIEGELRRQFRDNFDFTLPRFEILGQLDREPSGLVQGELSKRLMVSQANVTPIIERLIKDGLVTRQPSPLDRRIQIVCLTMEGRQKFRRMAKKHNAWLAAIMKGFSPDDIDELSAKLTSLKHILASNANDRR